MGYAMMVGSCYTCGRTFTFNPVKVPSFRDKHNERQPVCKDCIDQANPKRIANGLPAFTYAADAYTFCDESEL